MKQLLFILLFISTSARSQWLWCPMDDYYFDFQDFRRLYPFLARPEPEPGPDLVKIRKPHYERNPNAPYCKRPTDMLDTIVLHHTDTPSFWTAEMINNFHLERSTNNEPWYMIAYSYVINSPYEGEYYPPMGISEGRPLEIVGAHAGGEAFVPMDNVQTKLWEAGEITCGLEGEEFKVNPDLIKNGKIKANVTTLGLVVSGNYAPFSAENPNGYRKGQIRNPSYETQDLIAKLSCQLQKKYPRIKKISWHSKYKPTSCPGNIKNFVSQIKDLARRYGCSFE